MTWREYEQALEERLVDMHARVHRGAYRALPSRRTFIPKGDGQRPLGVAVLEDKIVQRALVEVLNAIYEEDFLGFSYGFRPARSQHDALDAPAFGITRTKLNYVLDCDVRSFFDSVSHDWLVRFLEHRIGDPRVIRLIRKWLQSGVMEEGKWTPTEVGTPQGEWPPRYSPTSTCITVLTHGLNDGDILRPMATSSWCATPTIFSLVLSTRTMPNVSWRIRALTAGPLLL